MEKVENWTKQKEWHGNPELGYDCYLKTFRNPFNGVTTPVYIFGKEGSGKDTPIYGRDENDNPIVISGHKFDAPDWSFVVSAGANSEYSYSGGFYPATPTLEQTMEIVDKMYKDGKLIH